MLTIQKIDQNRISIRCHYAYRQRCHDIPGATFDHDHKYWIAPLTSLSYIQTAFAGEIYYKTPQWKLEGRSEPTKKRIRFLGPVPDIPHLEVEPYGYQKDGIRFMIDRLNNEGFCLCGDGVGLGKTLQTIGALKWFVENRGSRKILIVCKKSLKTQWESEIRRIAGWQAVPIYITGGSTKKQKMKAYEGIQAAQNGILIANYQDFINWKNEIDKVNYDVCVIDEAHCIKGREGKMNNLIADTCRNKRVILLTGTPVMSRPDDLYGIVSLAKPGFFGTYENFKDRYLVEDFNKKFYQWETVGAKNLDELHERLSRFLIMRTPEDAAIELPKLRKARHISCPMDEVQERLLAVVEKRKAEQDETRKNIINKEGYTPESKVKIDRINDMSKMFLASMQYIASDPAVLRERYRKDDPDMQDADKRKINMQLLKMLPENYKMSSKTQAAIDLVSELVDADEKVIVFCFYKSTAMMLLDHFKKIPGANPKVFTGETKDAERDAAVNTFREDPECRVLIGNDAMAEGLNLQVSRNIIHFEQAANCSKREQRDGRARRIGSQYEYVNITDICTENSFDEKRIAVLRRQYLESRGTMGGVGRYRTGA